MLSSNLFRIFIAEMDDKIVGFVCSSIMIYNPFKKVKNLSRIDLIVVEKNLRRRGIGTMLLDKSLNYLDKKESSHVLVDVKKGNPSMDFFGKRYFTRLSSSSFIHADGSKEILYHLIRRVS